MVLSGQMSLAADEWSWDLNPTFPDSRTSFHIVGFSSERPLCYPSTMSSRGGKVPIGRLWKAWPPCFPHGSLSLTEARSWGDVKAAALFPVQRWTAGPQLLRSHDSPLLLSVAAVINFHRFNESV